MPSAGRCGAFPEESQKGVVVRAGIWNGLNMLHELHYAITSTAGQKWSMQFPCKCPTTRLVWQNPSIHTYYIDTRELFVLPLVIFNVVVFEVFTCGLTLFSAMNELGCEQTPDPFCHEYKFTHVWYICTHRALISDIHTHLRLLSWWFMRLI